MANVVIDKETVKKIGQLARVKIEEHESEKYANDITAVLNWFEMLDEVDVSSTPPANSRNQQATPLRQDVVTDGGMVDAVIVNATDAKFNMFSVPKVVE
jgi:aspartyl-tRNA(Asn)/glutamyl-tRNA(Gln) amidotransferase subunit C